MAGKPADTGVPGRRPHYGNAHGGHRDRGVPGRSVRPGRCFLHTTCPCAHPAWYSRPRHDADACADEGRADCARGNSAGGRRDPGPHREAGGHPRTDSGPVGKPVSIAGAQRDPRTLAERERGTVALPIAISSPVADGKATADSSAIGRPVADPNPGAVRSAVPNIAVTARRAGPATPFRALRKAMEQTRAGSVDTTKGAPGPTRTREPTAPVHAQTINPLWEECT